MSSPVLMMFPLNLSPSSMKALLLEQPTVTTSLARLHLDTAFNLDSQVLDFLTAITFTFASLPPPPMAAFLYYLPVKCLHVWNLKLKQLPLHHDFCFSAPSSFSNCSWTELLARSTVFSLAVTNASCLHFLFHVFWFTDIYSTIFFFRPPFSRICLAKT